VTLLSHDTGYGGACCRPHWPPKAAGGANLQGACLRAFELDLASELPAPPNGPGVAFSPHQRNKSRTATAQRNVIVSVIVSPGVSGQIWLIDRAPMLDKSLEPGRLPGTHAP
jgi:hypothetical protein